MDAKEITEIIQALAPAGQAVHSTASLFLVKELVSAVMPTVAISIVVGVASYTILRCKKNREQEEMQTFLSNQARTYGDVTKLTHVEHEDQVAIKDAINAYIERNHEVKATNFSKSYGYKALKKDKADALVKFLREN